MKQIVVFILLFAVMGNAVGADGISVSIKLVEQKIYFLNDDIEIKITVKNDGVDTRQFRVADNRVFSLDFDVRTAANRPGERHSEQFQNARNSAKPVFYREVTLAPGEEYSLAVKFGDYVALGEPGLYYVQALFFPDLYMADDSQAIASNKLALNLRPAVASTAERGAVEARVERAQQRDTFPPDEVVSYMIRARMTDQWSKFFLYINLEELYKNSYLKTRQNLDQFNKLAEADRKKRVEAYRAQIMAGKAEWYLVLKSSDFAVEETAYTPYEATVLVKQTYQHPAYREPRRYRYFLRRTGNVWEIVNYEASIANTASR